MHDLDTRRIYRCLDIFKEVIDNKQYNVILSVTLKKKDNENSVYIYTVPVQCVPDYLGT
jgi:preprotein translocase subunit SecB